MVIDSHVLYWWLDGHRRLSRKAAAFFEACCAGDAGCLLSPVSLWEFALKERRGKFEASRPVREWPTYLGRLGWLELKPTTVEIWLLAAELDWKHRDPADRIIAATALHHRVPVLSKDRVFHLKSSPVEAVW